MSDTTPRTYEDFWPYYVRQHSKRETRLLHAVGTAVFVSTVLAFLATRRKSLLLAMPVVGYGPAWYSHFFIEGNRPATFGHPFWSLRADFEMVARMLTGTMDLEVERYCNAPAAEAPAEPVAAAAASAPAPQRPANGQATHDRTLH